MPTEIINLLTGAGGSAVLMWLWLSSEKKEKASLIEEINELHQRERERTEKVIEALLLNKQFLEDHRGEFSKLGETIEVEFKRIEETLKSIACDPPKTD